MADLTKAEQRTKTALSNLINLGHPVALVVEPLRADTVQRTKLEALVTVERVIEGLEAAGWDMHKYAPYPTTQEHGYGWKYHAALTHYRLVSSLVTWLNATSRPNEPNPVKMDQKKIERFITESEEQAALDYDAFIVKLCSKIGECQEVTISGSHVWGYSHLTVTKATGVEVWKTQQIINQSKLGKLFNQWPSRKVKK